MWVGGGGGVIFTGWMVFMLHIDFNIWLIKFTVRPAVILACDYLMEESIFNFGGGGCGHLSLSGGRKGNSTEALRLVVSARDRSPRSTSVPPVLAPPLSLHPLANISP